MKDMLQLQMLSLYYCNQITDDGLVNLADMTQLETLDLSGCSITGSGFECLKNLQQLHTLKLFTCNQLVDANLMLLSDLTQLKTLDVDGCLSIGVETVQELQKALPECKIKH